MIFPHISKDVEISYFLAENVKEIPYFHVVNIVEISCLLIGNTAFPCGNTVFPCSELYGNFMLSSKESQGNKVFPLSKSCGNFVTDYGTGSKKRHHFSHIIFKYIYQFANVFTNICSKSVKCLKNCQKTLSLDERF